MHVVMFGYNFSYEYNNSIILRFDLQNPWEKMHIASHHIAYSLWQLFQNNWRLLFDLHATFMLYDDGVQFLIILIIVSQTTSHHLKLFWRYGWTCIRIHIYIVSNRPNEQWLDARMGRFAPMRSWVMIQERVAI